MTAVGWAEEDGWDDDEPAPEPTPAVPAYYCEGPCCWVPPRPPGLLKRLVAGLRRRLTEGTAR